MSSRLLNVSNERDLTISLDSLYQCSVTCTVKTMFLRFGGNLLCLVLCPLPLVLSLGTTKKNLALSSLLPHCRYLRTLTNSPQSLFFSRLNSPSSVSLFSYVRCPSSWSPSWSFIGLSAVCPCSLVLWNPEVDTAHPHVASSGLTRGEGSPPSVC